MNIASLAFGFVMANASGVDSQRALEVGLVAGISNLPPVGAALISLVLAKSLAPEGTTAPSTVPVALPGATPDAGGIVIPSLVGFGQGVKADGQPATAPTTSTSSSTSSSTPTSGDIAEVALSQRHSKYRDTPGRNAKPGDA